ncbi:MAG: hypothetical protein KDK34_21095, partial [Leptospiraceae bacterium]|nr:hypothetical protein [Leptospiraceae bacterium]
SVSPLSSTSILLPSSITSPVESSGTSGSSAGSSGASGTSGASGSSSGSSITSGGFSGGVT